MGTPSDKKSISQVVPEITEKNPHQPTTASQLNPLEFNNSSNSEDNNLSTNEMTILRNIPSLGIFLEGENLDQSVIEKDIFDDTGQNVNLETLEKIERDLLITTKRDESEELGVAGPSGFQETKKKSDKSLTLKKFVCAICSKSFNSATKLVNHQNIHGETTPFKCEQCKKAFSSKFKLVRHVLIHSDRKPFSCTVCERTFHRKDHLKNHIKVHSPSKKIFTCEKTNCRKEYTSIMSYRKHLALHSAEEGSLDCKICSKSFETKPDILYHLKIHAGSRTVKNPNEKKFTCDHCDRKFFTRKDVRRHLVVHTGTRNFLCQFCPQRFGRKDHLVRHIKKSHSSNIPENEMSLYDTKIDNPTLKSSVEKVTEIGMQKLSSAEPKLVATVDSDLKSLLFQQTESILIKNVPEEKYQPKSETGLPIGDFVPTKSVFESKSVFEHQKSVFEPHKGVFEPQKCGLEPKSIFEHQKGVFEPQSDLEPQGSVIDHKSVLEPKSAFVHQESDFEPKSVFQHEKDIFEPPKSVLEAKSAFEHQESVFEHQKNVFESKNAFEPQESVYELGKVLRFETAILERDKSVKSKNVLIFEENIDEPDLGRPKNVAFDKVKMGYEAAILNPKTSTKPKNILIVPDNSNYPSKNIEPQIPKPQKNIFEPQKSAYETQKSAQISVFETQKSLEFRKSVFESRERLFQTQEVQLPPQSIVDPQKNVIESQSVFEPQRSIFELQKSVYESQESASKIQSIYKPQESIFKHQEIVFEPQGSVNKPQNSVELHKNVFDTQSNVFATEKRVGQSQTVYEPQESVFDPQKSVFDPQKSVFDPQKSVFDSQKSVFDPQKSVFDPQKSVFDPQKSVFDPQKSVFDPQKSVFDPQKSVFESQNVLSKMLGYESSILESNTSKYDPKVTFTSKGSFESENPNTDGILAQNVVRKEIFFQENPNLTCDDSQEVSKSDYENQNMDKMLDFSSSESILDDSMKSDMASVENILGTESVEKMLNYPTESQLKLDDESNKNELSVENILFPQTFSQLSPMLCSESDNLQYLPHHNVETCDANRELFIKNPNLTSDTELLTELVVMKEELDCLTGQSTSSQNVDLLTVSQQDITDLNNAQLMTSEIMDSDILRLISESSNDLTQNDDENNLPLPGFSQAFQQPP